MSLAFSTLSKNIFYGKGSYGFFIAAIMNFAFSIAVILSTLGIMDGFDQTLREGLNRSTGDFQIFSRQGFFDQDLNILKTDDGPEFKHTPIIQMEGFLVYADQSKGVMLRGVEPTSFNQVTGLNLNLGSEDVCIGRVLSDKLKAQLQDEIVLTFATGVRGGADSPILHRFKISCIVEHGNYKKDERLVYINLDFLQKLLNYKNRINLRLAKFTNEEKLRSELVQKLLPLADMNLIPSLHTRAYWKEYGGLIEAVEYEKVSISIILQIVVIVSIFNIVAFFIFLNEKKAKEIFLIRTLGVKQRQLTQFWITLALVLWILSCAIALILVEIFSMILTYSTLFKIPGDVYVLENLKIVLGFKEIALTFSGAFVWLVLIIGFNIWRMKRSSLLSSLRREFA